MDVVKCLQDTIRHDVTAKTLFNAIRKLHKPDIRKMPRSYADEMILNEGDYEY